MTTITVNQDCGNSPKNAFVRDFNIAFAENEVEFILDNVSDDITWTMSGDQEIQGKSDFTEAVRNMKDEKTTELIIDHAITHGAIGAVDGTLKLDNGTVYAFCDMYEFSSHGKNAKIQTITSYVVEIDE